MCLQSKPLNCIFPGWESLSMAFKILHRDDATDAQRPAHQRYTTLRLTWASTYEMNSNFNVLVQSCCCATNQGRMADPLKLFRRLRHGLLMSFHGNINLPATSTSNHSTF